MDELVFENDRMDSPRVQKSKLAQNPSTTNAFKEFARGAKNEAGQSPSRKHILNKKNQEATSKTSGVSGGKQQSQASSGVNNGKAAVSELSPQALSKNKDLQTSGQGKGASGQSALSDVKDLGVVGGKKRGNENDSQGINLNSQKEDSFQKLYSKELDLDEDEVPIILHELNDSAIHFISHEQYERSLSLLQKAQTLLDRLKFQKNPKDRFLIQVTMHNMALCFQKMGALEECALCLDACLHQINSQYLAPIFTRKPTKKLKKLKYECKIHMQVCALLSQLHRHEEALLHAKQAVQISQYLVNDLVSLCELNVEKTIIAKKKEQEVHEEQERQKFEHGGMSMSNTSSQADLIYYDHSISMLERTALRVFPIIKEIQNRMVKHKDVSGSFETTQKQQDANESTEKAAADRELFMADNQSLNMKVLLGYLNQSEWLYLLNIGNIMQITPLTIHDLYSNQKIDVELSRDSILEKITFLAISYFCVSTELRFLVSSKEKLSFDPVYVKAESEFWHGKALEISCGFLPSESPLVTHILSSYQKHHAPVQQAIPENEEEEQGLRVIRPEKGIDKSQFQPIIRLNKHLNIALSPLRLSPNNHRSMLKTNNMLSKPKVEVKEVSVTANLLSEQTQPLQQQPIKIERVSANVQEQDQQQFSDEEAMLLQVMQNHPSKRSIEFTNSQAQDISSKDQLHQLQTPVSSTNIKSNNGQQQQQINGPDVVEYELESYDQNIDTELSSNNQRPPMQQQQQQMQSSQRPPQHQQHTQQPPPHQQPQTQQNATTTPNRGVDQGGNKIQMAVPSPNALASAMQREQRESLTQLSVQESRSHQSQQLNPSENNKAEAAKKVQTQRLLAGKNDAGGIQSQQQDKQSSSFKALPVGFAAEPAENDINSQLNQRRSIDENTLIHLANDGQAAITKYETSNNHRFEPMLEQQQHHHHPQQQNHHHHHHNQGKQQLQARPKGGEDMQRESTRFDPHKSRPQPGGSKELRNKHSGRGGGPQHQQNNNQQAAISQKFKTTTSGEHQSDSADERTPTGLQPQSSARLSGSNNLGHSQRSRSKGKMQMGGVASAGASQNVQKKQKAAGMLTQPQTHQNSANNTAYEPLRQAMQSQKEISHFNAPEPSRKNQQRDGRTTGHSLEGADDEQQQMHSTGMGKSRQSHKGLNKNGGMTQKTSTGAGRIATSSLENRDNTQVVKPQLASKSGQQSAHGDGAVQRPDSRRMIGGKRRQIKDQKPETVRSSSAGRRNQNQTLQMQGYKTNDQSMTSASSHVQFNMNGQQLQGGMHTSNNPQHVSANNFKTFQQTRKAVTAHSTQASNSPRKPLPSSKYSDSTNNVTRMSKQGHAVGTGAASGVNAGMHDAVFMNSNQLNQSRSTIENNNSSMIDRSMNDQLMLNNSSFEMVNAQSRSRSFAKTNALSQQNSRDVIVGGAKKKTVGQHPSQQPLQSSKSQGKKTANKEMLNYLNQGTTTSSAAQKNMNTLLGAQQQQQNASKYNTGSNSATGVRGGEDVDYRKQMLIKQALDIQQQTKEQRQKSGQKGGTTSNRTQMAFQSHASSVQMPLNHTNSVSQNKQQSHSSQGLRKSSHGIQKETANQAAQSQKVLNNSHQQQQQQQQISQLDPQAIAAIQQALNLNNKGAGGQQQNNNAQLIYNQILQFQQQSNGQQMQSNSGSGQPSQQPPSSQTGGKKSQNSQHTHTMIKKFLKDRATPQPPPSLQANLVSSSSSNNPQQILISQNLMAGQPSRQGHSHSPNPTGQQNRNGPGGINSHSTTLIDNFTQAPFLVQNSAASISAGIPSSKQAHTTKASAEHSKQQRANVVTQFSSSNPQKIFTQKQPTSSSQKTTASQQAQNQAAGSSYGYNTEQHLHQHIVGGRKGAQERFNDKSKQQSTDGNGQQREPTPVFHHLPYQKPDDPMEADNLAQYPMQPQQAHHHQKGGNAAKANKQLAAMYKSIKGEK